MADLIKNLGLSWQSMVLHASALVILILAFRFLLYKPLKKMVDSRREALDHVYTENQRLNTEALEIKGKYEKTLADTKLEAARMATEASAAAEAKGSDIIAEARKKADEILAAAAAGADAERTRLQNEFKTDVTALSLNIAEAVLSREVKEKDNERIIADALNAWGKDV